MNAVVRTLAVLTGTLVVLGASTATAVADAPTGGAWPDGDQRSGLELLVYFGGATVGLFVIVALFGLLTARNNYVPPAPGTDLEVAPGNEAAHH